MGLGTNAEIEDVRTTRLTLNLLAASRTLSVPCTAGRSKSFSGSLGSSREQGDATWKTPEQPSTALHTASKSKTSASKTWMELELELSSCNKWVGSDPGKMEAWMEV